MSIISNKSRADYFKERRKNTKSFYVEIERNKMELFEQNLHINIRTSVRLDAETDKKLIAYCKKYKMTKGEAIRKGVHLLLGE